MKKILILSNHNGIEHIRPMEKEKDGPPVQEIKADEDNILWLTETQRYDKPDPDILVIVIDWNSFKSDIKPESVAKIVSKLRKMHPDVPIIQNIR
jgi:hypothetical protein